MVVKIYQSRPILTRSIDTFFVSKNPLCAVGGLV